MMKTVCNRACFGSLFVFQGGPVYTLIWPDCELVDSGCYFYSDALWDRSREILLSFFFKFLKGKKEIKDQHFLKQVC
jgi:hypothetical protein